MSDSSDVVVLRVETHRVHDGDAEPNLRWRILGTLQDLNWDRTTQLFLGPQTEPYVFLLDAREIGVNPDDCLAYLKAETNWLALVREEALHYNGCAVNSSLREAEEELMGYFGDKIDTAVSAHFDSAESDESK